jgi:hypothetical protein
MSQTVVLFELTLTIEHTGQGLNCHPRDSLFSTSNVRSVGRSGRRLLEIRSSNSLIFFYLPWSAPLLFVPSPLVNLISSSARPSVSVVDLSVSTCQADLETHHFQPNSASKPQITTLLPLAALSRASKKLTKLDLFKRGFQHSSLMILLTGQHPSCLACPQEICGAVPPVLLGICPPCSRLSGCRYS